MPGYTLKLDSGPLNEAVSKLEKIAKLYERIGAAQTGVAAGPSVGGGTIRTGGAGVRVRSGRSGGSVVENLMRSNPGLSPEAAARIAGNLPAGSIREGGDAERYFRNMGHMSAMQAARAETRQLADANAARNLFFRNLNATDTRRAEYRNVERQLAKDLDEAFGGGGAGGAGGGRGAAGGAGRRNFGLRERFRVAGTGLVGGVGGPWALAAAGVFSFITAIRGAVQSVDQLNRTALTTGGTLQQAARLQALGVKAAEANALRDRLASDPWAMMTMGFMPDPRLGGDQNNARLQTRAIEILRSLRGNPNAQLLAARRLGVSEDVMRVANLGDDAFRDTMDVGRFAPNAQQTRNITDTQQQLSNFWTRMQFGFARLLPRMFSVRPGLPGMSLIRDIQEAFSPNQKEKGPDSLQGAIQAQTSATMQLIAVMKENQRDFFGRGMNDRTGMPTALFGDALIKGIKSGAIRMGAFDT